MKLFDVSFILSLLSKLSIPFSAVPDPDIMIEALPGCWSKDVPKRWKSIKTGDYLRRKLEGIYESHLG